MRASREKALFDCYVNWDRFLLKVLVLNDNWSMDLEVFSTQASPSRDLVKCCNCDCSCSLITGSSSGSWIRSVKRKHDEFEEGNRFYIPGFDSFSNPRVQIENECAALREMVSSQQQTVQDLYTELEEERNAA